MIDLGAAPGSWTQVAVQKTNADGSDPRKPKGFVLAVDMVPIVPMTVCTVICIAIFRLVYFIVLLMYNVIVTH